MDRPLTSSPGLRRDGSLTLDKLTDLVVSTVETAVSYGFDAGLLINGHGGNAALIADVAVKAGMESTAEVLGLIYFSLAESVVDDIRESEHGALLMPENSKHR